MEVTTRVTNHSQRPKPANNQQSTNREARTCSKRQAAAASIRIQHPGAAPQLARSALPPTLSAHRSTARPEAPAARTYLTTKAATTNRRGGAAGRVRRYPRALDSHLGPR
eukprot:scaffold4232_cov107-Isochrysis_galbana.AAC.8